MSSFAILGEALIDLRVVDRAEPEHEDRPATRAYTAQPGGSPFNVAIGLGRLGHRAEFVGTIAEDALGGILRRHAEHSHVELEYSGTWAGPTPTAVFDLDPDGSARYEFHLGGAHQTIFAADRAARVDPSAVDAVHFGSIASWLPGSAEAVLGTVARLRENGVFVSYDPNIRTMLMPDRAAALTAAERAITISDVVKASVEDLEWLSPGRRTADVAYDWIKHGALAVVVTHGAEGADCYTASGVTHGRGIPVTVVDTVGAGDAFMAGLLDGIAQQGALSRAGLAALFTHAADAQHLLDDACAYAAATCTRHGADPPWTRIPMPA